MSYVVILVLVVAQALTLAQPSYKIDTAAGSNWVGDNDLGILAVLFQAEGLASDKNGNLYIADAADHRVRRLSAGGTITTAAGTGAGGFSGDGGPATAAQLNSPYGLALDSQGNLYIADLGNARVRRVSTDGTISTVASTGLAAPRNLAFDAAGNLYISDFSAHRVYRQGSTGVLTAVAGTGVAGNSGDGGAAVHAQLAFPAGLALDRQGSLYIADSGNHLVRKVSNGVISSVADTSTPTGLGFDSSGTLYVADPSAAQVLKIPVAGPTAAVSVPANEVAFSTSGDWYASAGAQVLRISPSGAITIAAGGGDPAHGDDGPAVNARLNHPTGVAMDAVGNLYIADRDNHRVRRVAGNGTITTIAGTGIAGDVGDGGPAIYAQLNTPSSVAVDSAGDIYIADTGNHRVRMMTPDGIVRAVVSGFASPTYVTLDNAGNLYIADEGAGMIFKAGSGGVPQLLLANLASPHGLALDAQGYLYFSEASAARVRVMAPNGEMGTLGAGVWSAPRGIARDAAGRLFVADAGLEQVLEVDASGNVSPIAGTGAAGFSGDRGAALLAQLSFPWDLALGPNGVIAVADLNNNRVRELSPVPAAPPAVTAPPSSADAVNAASLAGGPVAPGMLVLLRNTGLGASQIPQTQVFFGSAPAMIIAADQSGILVLAPAAIAGSGSTEINVVYQGSPVAAIPVAVADAAPGLYASITNQDGSTNSQVNPAARGSVVSLYGTGMGISGAPVSVTIGGYPAQVLYAGPVSGYPGLFQVNAQVPTGYLGAGVFSVIVNAGSSSTQPNVSVWVN